MFIGHLAPAIALASRKDAPSLAILCIGAQLVDIGFFLFVPLGIEHMRITPGMTKLMPFDLYHMPYTHSLLGTAVFALLFGWLVMLRVSATMKRRAGIIASLTVLSHWFLDVLVHRPDMTVYGRDTPIGFGLWNYPVVEIILELGLVLAAVWLYHSRSKPRRHPPSVWSRHAPRFFLSSLFLLQGVNWFGPPPETVMQATIMALLAFLLISVISWFVQRARKPA